MPFPRAKTLALNEVEEAMCGLAYCLKCHFCTCGGFKCSVCSITVSALPAVMVVGPLALACRSAARSEKSLCSTLMIRVMSDSSEEAYIGTKERPLRRCN